MGADLAHLPPDLPRVFGLSASDLEYQREAKERLELPFELLADPGFELARALRLPTFTLAGQTYYKRVTMLLEGGMIRKVFYPVFPPNLNAAEVVAWLGRATGEGSRLAP
jgi:peroxiredoxin